MYMNKNIRGRIYFSIFLDNLLPWYGDRSASLARNPRRRRRKDLSAAQLPSAAP